MLDGQKLKLGETEYVIPPLNLKSMRRLLPRIGKLTVVGLPTDEDLETITEVVHSALLRNYPDISKEVIEDGLDVVNMKPALGMVLGQSGLQAGNVTAATGSHSIGPSSTGTSSPPQDGPTTT